MRYARGLGFVQGGILVLPRGDDEDFITGEPRFQRKLDEHFKRVLTRNSPSQATKCPPGIARALFAWFYVCGMASWTGHAADAGEEFFEKRIRPLLIERCYECHSAEKGKSKGGLLLNSKSGLTRGGDSGPAIVPGDPEKSLLIRAVRWLDEDTQMPPKNKLSPSEIEWLVAWVKMGAPDPRVTTGNSTAPADSPLSHTNHWAYQPVKPMPPPRVKQKAWPQGDIDAFVLSAIERKGGSVVKDAPAGVLARRLYFDLTGLPPTPHELTEFEAAAKQDRRSATATLVDRLLASPRFGEHWARHWLDVARFAESVTLRGFIFKPAWRYRDYVIEAFNRDLPFDQFIREQIAGDLLPHTGVAERRRQLAAAMFLTLGNWNLEEQDKKQLDMDVVDEQLDTIGKAFLGQTLGCARCHDHKFDPIPTRDYYAMAGILKNSQTLKHANVSEWLETALPVDPDLERQLHEHERAVEKLQTKLGEAKDSMKALSGATGEGKTTSGIVAARELPGIVVDSAQARAVGTWKHSQYSKRYIGDGYWHDDNAEKGEKTLSFTPELAKPGRYEVRLAYVHAENRATNIPVTIFHADGETVVRVNQREAPVADGRFVSLGQFRFEANGFGYVLVANEGTSGYVTADAVQFLPTDEANGAARLVQKESSVVSEGKAKELAALSASVKALELELKQLQQSGPKRPMVMGLKEATKPADLAVHVRGSVHNLGPVVPRGFMAVASRGTSPPMPKDQSGRREFADWIANPENPLTARVFVNRVWLWLFGDGLVRSPDNFGTTGDTPVHAELLDYLAGRFVSEGWSTKKLIRELVTSRLYQLDSRPTEWAAKNDPENRLFSHALRQRLTAEQLRDAMLFVSGRLDLETGGQTYPADRAADYGFVYSGARRSVYVPVFRNALPELFEAFDFAPASMVTGKREVSTVPTQALFLLNHPFVRQQAEAAADRIDTTNRTSLETRIASAYQLALGRLPTKRELQLTQQHFAGASGVEREAWAELFHALFASADFRYLD